MSRSPGSVFTPQTKSSSVFIFEGKSKRSPSASNSSSKLISTNMIPGIFLVCVYIIYTHSFYIIIPTSFFIFFINLYCVFLYCKLLFRLDFLTLISVC
ncbi:transcription factor jungbrunnen 1 [Phtheirospermum japonicum]|uniref:Transcription factor jungbrunnen 1 n=1 Tax=Phtheirospermum japonicum TaxID=374723 RepID=A0A830BN39_9LAMI|nr:transcription factor jungbrunnen 1 [Phtheirospermum japonicum]